jgi:hypothetical protein
MRPAKMPQILPTLVAAVFFAAVAPFAHGEPIKTITAQVENGGIFNSAVGRLFINTEHIGGEVEQIPLAGAYANGGFTVTLPEKIGAEYLGEIVAMEHFDGDWARISDKKTKVFTFARINGGNRDRAANFKLRDLSNVEINRFGDGEGDIEIHSDEKSVAFWYVDRDVTVHGGGADEGSHISLTLKKGWNKVYKWENDVTGNFMWSTNQPADWNAKWRAIDIAEGNSNYRSALETRFAKGTLGAAGKTRPIEMFFTDVYRQYDHYTIDGKSKTSSAEDAFTGTLEVGAIGGKPASGLCGGGETEFAGIYNLKEKESKTSGRFIGSFTACEKEGKLLKAKFEGNWVKDANGNKTPCNFGL